MTRWWVRVALLGATAIAGCAAVDRQVRLAPPPGMHVEGAPAIEQRWARLAERYGRVEGHRLVDWHPRRSELLVAHRAPQTRTTQLGLIAEAAGTLRPMTRGNEPVTRAEWEPDRGRYLVFSRAEGGNEADRLWRLDAEGQVAVPLTAADHRSSLLGWLPGAPARIVVASTPLDHQREGGRSAPIDTDLQVIDPLNPDAAPALRRLPGIGWAAMAATPDGRGIVLAQWRSTTDSSLWWLDLDRPGASPRPIGPRAGPDGTAMHRPVAFSVDGNTLFLLTDRFGEYRELARMSLASGVIERFGPDIPWDVDDVELSPDGRWLALRVNVAGRGELRVLDARSGRAQPLPPLPAGSLSAIDWHPATGALALQTDSAQGPARVHVLSPDLSTVTAWTQPAVAADLHPEHFVDAQPMQWTGHDGLVLSGWIHRPDPSRFAGPRPVVVLVHGGPAAQARSGWLGRYHALVEERGLALLQPNVRGSSGFGKRFLGLDDGLRREDAVRDLAALLDWIGTQPDLDARRVVVMGGSYGGYMSLAAAVQLGDRIAGAVSTVGISNFVSFLERTESYRRDLRRTEYGDERDPAMRAFLQRISPLHQADRITRPLLVIQGRNDPRVPWTESEQIVRALQTRGRTVWYLLAADEGHGFVRRDNAEFAFATVLQFLDATLR